MMHFLEERKWIIERYIMKRTRRLNKTDVEDKIGICFNGKEINGETGVKTNPTNESNRNSSSPNFLESNQIASMINLTL